MITRTLTFRDIASWKIINMPLVQFGGPGKIVQIDESVITKRKYNRGRGVRNDRKEKWVLGIYDVETKKGVVLYVVKRDKQTLVPLIQQYVAEVTFGLISGLPTRVWTNWGTFITQSTIQKNLKVLMEHVQME